MLLGTLAALPVWWWGVRRLALGVVPLLQQRRRRLAQPRMLRLRQRPAPPRVVTAAEEAVPAPDAWPPGWHAPLVGATPADLARQAPPQLPFLHSSSMIVGGGWGDRVADQGQLFLPGAAGCMPT